MSFLSICLHPIHNGGSRTNRERLRTSVTTGDFTAIICAFRTQSRVFAAAVTTAAADGDDNDHDNDDV